MRGALASRLDSSRFQPLVVCLNRSGPAAKWLETDDVPIFELHKGPRNDLGVIFRLKSLLREQRVDIVHSHNWGTLVETSLARRWARTAVHIHAERGTVLGDAGRRGLRRFIRTAAMRWSVGRASGLVSNAVAVARRAALSAGVPFEQIRIIPNGLDVPRVVPETETQELRCQLQIPADAILVGSVGRLVDVKNFASAIDAVGQLSSGDSPIHLLLVGDGPERDRLMQQARDLGLAQQIHFVGWADDVGPALAAMDIFINCSKSEGMSQSLVEAMAAGRPLVVTDVGDNALLAGGDGACGLVVPAGDAAGLSAALASLANDAVQRDALRRNGLLRFTERYSIERMVSSYEFLYAQLYCSCGSRENDLRPNVAEVLPPMNLPIVIWLALFATLWSSSRSSGRRTPLPYICRRSLPARIFGGGGRSKSVDIAGICSEAWSCYLQSYSEAA